MLDRKGCNATAEGEVAVDQPWAELRESHSAVVLLAGDRAYKLKKPVSLGFLDYSTPQAREAAWAVVCSSNQRQYTIGLSAYTNDCTSPGRSIGMSRS